MRRALGVVVLAFALGATSPVPAQAPGDLDSFLAGLQAVVESGDPVAFGALLGPEADREKAAAFAVDLVRPGATRVVVRERDRAPLPAGADRPVLRLLVEIFVESGSSARILTAFLDLVRLESAETGLPPVWLVADLRRVASLDGLYDLTLDPTRQFDVSGLVVADEDFSITMSRGSAFVAEIANGPTAIVLVGNGTLRFAPRPAAERGQVKVFSGHEVLDSPVRTAFIRVNPSDLDNHFDPSLMRPRAVNPRDLQRAQEVFAEEVDKSFSLDLSDLSRESWSLVPTYGDFLVEVGTRRQGTLTYARSAREAEDVSFFNRRLRRNISVYASERRLRERGPSYSEDELADYDVLDSVIEVSFDPERRWFDGRARLRVRARRFLPLMTVRLAESLVPRSVVSSRHGRLLALRVRGQNSVIVNFPEPVQEGDVLDLAVVYSGRLDPQPVDREVVEVDGQEPLGFQDQPTLVPEQRFVYSNRSYWYPQNTVTDYATATVRVAVPTDYGCVASGDPSVNNPSRVPPEQPGRDARLLYEFVAGQPLRYLAFVASRFTPSATATVRLPDATGGSLVDRRQDVAAGVYYDSLDLAVTANPRQVGRAKSLTEEISEILSFYSGLVADLPYPTLTVAVVDSDLPGGHSPAYFALVNQPLPTTPFFWRNDPVAFNNFPSFFLAHELAHQYWGQAVGWENYHEQWISEGFAQYFALLYAQRVRGDATMRDIVRQMNRSVMDYDDQGPISLGYRLGHIKGDSRVFRAIVYNKSAVVLHMLRRLLGDETFFRGLRAFYHQSRFTKVGTDDVRRAFEEAAGRSLDEFFDRWIQNADIPALDFRWDVEGSEVRLRFEQRGLLFEMPVTVTLSYRSGETQDVIVPVADRLTELRVPVKGPLRSVKANEDYAALARIR